MCDYSLHGLENRLAKEAEVLMVHRFFSGSKGLISLDNPKPVVPQTGFRNTVRRIFGWKPYPQPVAVCIPDGACLLMTDIPWGFCQEHKLDSEEDVMFRQMSANDYEYRDAVEFKSGLKVRLQELETGQKLTVLSLSGEETEMEYLNSEVHSA